MPNSSLAIRGCFRIRGLAAPFRSSLGAAVLLVLAACGDLTRPGGEARPQLQLFFVDELRSLLNHGGVIYALGVPADTAFRLPSGKRVRFAIEASSGDAEEGRLYRLYCPARERAQGFRCFDFGVWMQAGHSVAEIWERVTAHGWRFNIAFGSGGSITVFEPERLVQQAREARSWPGVATTELTYSGCQQESPHWCKSLSRLAVPIPVDTGSGVPGDGDLAGSCRGHHQTHVPAARRE